MYLLKAKKRVAQGPSPIPSDHERILSPSSNRYRNRQPQIDVNGKLPGIVKHCKYIGTFKVRNGLSSEARASAIKQHLSPLMAEYKSKSRKEYKLVGLQMLDQGVKVLNKELNCVLMAHALSRISYSVAEPKDGLLAFAAKDPEGTNPQTYCHAFIFDNPKEASEINTTLGNAFRLAYCKRTLKRRTRSDNQSLHTNSSSSTGTTDSAAILRAKRTNVCQIRPVQNGCHRNPYPGNHHGLVLEGIKTCDVIRQTAVSPALSHHDRYAGDIKKLKDLDPESRIKDWLHDASPVLSIEEEPAPIFPSYVPRISPVDQSPTHAVPGHSPGHSPDKIRGRCVRGGGGCLPFQNNGNVNDLRRPSKVSEDHIPQELKDQEWFQAGIPRHIALECLSMECEGAFIVRNSQTHKDCYALSLRGPGRGSSGTYHYLISQNSEGFYFQGGGRVFPDLTSLIHHHLYEKEGLVCRLSMNRNNPLFGDDLDSSDLEEEDADYNQPPDVGFTTLLPAK